MDIHNYKRQFERQVELLKEDKDISEENRKISLEFKDYLISEGLGFAKIGRYLLDVRKFAKILNKPFKKADKKDIRRVIAEIEQGKLSPESKKCFKILVRKLYRFVRGIDEKGVYPEEVRWISTSLPKNHKTLPDELLTEDEILEIIRKSGSIRNKAFISSLAESGCRISEIGTMKIKHLSFEQYGARITVKGKTGMRKILVIKSTPYLQQWTNEHPYNGNPDALLWCKSDGSCLSYNAFRKIIKQAAKRVGIKKRVNPHIFRHTRATRLASEMSEASMKQYFGWGQDSSMCGVYIHMNGEDMDKAILKANNIKVEEKKKKSKMKEKICLRCKTKNGVTNRCCYHCGFILDEEYAKEKIKEKSREEQAHKLMDKLMQDGEVKKLIKKKLGSIEN